MLGKVVSEAKRSTMVEGIGESTSICGAMLALRGKVQLGRICRAQLREELRESHESVC